MRKLIVIVLPILVVAGGVAFYKARQNPPAEAPAPPPKVVVTAAVEKGEVIEIVEVIGEVKPADDVVVSADATGRVIFLAKDGAAILSGGVIARLEDDRAAATAGSAEARAFALDADAAQKRREVERLERLQREGAVSVQDAERARSSLAAADASAGAAWEEARAQNSALGHFVIRAPFAGTVLRTEVERGEVVSAGTPIARFGNLASLVVEAAIAEADAIRISKNAEAKIRLDSLPGETLLAKVANIDGALADGSRTAKAVLVLNPSPRGIPAGALARVAIRGRSAKDVLRVPESAIAHGPEGDRVWVVENGVAGMRSVVVGLAGEGYVEIRSGVEEGTMVVTRGSESLSEGDKVSF